MEEALRAKLAAGDFDRLAAAPDFARAVGAVILEVSKDRHTGFAYNPAMAEDFRRLMSRSEEEVRQVRERQLEESRRDNFGFRRVERLPGNIGYLDFRVFASPGGAGPTAVAAMNFLAYCDALIVDLRQNGGGDPAQIQLISSYLFEEPVHLNDLYARATDTTENYWTLPFVPGARASKADVYVLTSSGTFSGAEEFSYNLQNLGRATIVGETTGGGAHPTDAMIVQRDFILRVPFARAINPVSKTNWEGTGVKPDIACPAADAFDRAYALAVEELSAKAVRPERKAEYEWILAGQKAKANPVHVDEKVLEVVRRDVWRAPSHPRERRPSLSADRPQVPARPSDGDPLRSRRERRFPARVRGQGREDRRARRSLRRRPEGRLAADEIARFSGPAGQALRRRRPRDPGRPPRRRPRGRRCRRWNSNMKACPAVRRSGSMGRRAERVSRKPARTKAQKAQALTRAGVMPIFRGSRSVRLSRAGRGTAMNCRPLKTTRTVSETANRPPATTWPTSGKAVKTPGDEQGEEEPAGREIEEARVQDDVEPSFQDRPAPQRQLPDIGRPGPRRGPAGHLHGPQRQPGEELLGDLGVEDGRRGPPAGSSRSGGRPGPGRSRRRRRG
ncbi:MAG: S41 family peptidase [Ignavibacteriales bacterium]|nr:S41 family peptidase [Ignavibacteriales bacterium]